MCAVSAAALLAACDLGTTTGEPGPGVVSANQGQGFIGGAAADEPRAALVARDVLAAGGTAADAAVALYFALAVTYPSTASLGGGGSCLIYRPGRKIGTDTTEVIEFAARASQVAGRVGDRPSAVPSAVRGMAALHARYGALRWENVLSPAEGLARFGVEMSRAFAHDLGLAAGPLLEDEGARRLFADAAGNARAEGDRIAMLDLAGVLAQLRLKGAGDFYSGALALRLVAAVEAAGGTLSLEELRAVAPVWRPTATLAVGNETLHTAPPPSEGGLIAARLFAALSDADRYAKAAPDERPHLVAEASVRAWDARDGSLDPSKAAALMEGYDPGRHQPTRRTDAYPPMNPAGTSFAVVDRAGMAITCTVSLNNLFGTGRVAPGLGIVLAASPRGADPATSFTPVVLVNHNTHQVFIAAAASGGAGALSALATFLRAALIEKAPLAAALAAPRLHNGGVPDRTYVEPGLAGAPMQALQARGHIAEQVPEIGRVNAIACLGGLPRAPESCAFGTDPRGFGLGVGGVY